MDAQRADRLAQIETLDAQLEQAKQLAAQRDAELDEARTAENRQRERYAVLTEVRETLEGFDAGTRAVMGAHLRGVRVGGETVTSVIWHGAIVHDGAPPTPRVDHASTTHGHLHPHDDGRQDEPEGVTPTVRWGA